MKKDDVRQAEEWVTRWYDKKGEVVKGILFGNPNRLSPPKERPSPWPKEVADFAVAKRLALVTTMQLFQAIVQSQTGATNPQQFLDAMFSTEGPFPA